MASLTLFFVALSASPILMTEATLLFRRAICNNFTISTVNDLTSYTQPGLRSFVISQGTTCTGTQECEVLTGGFVTDIRTLNITTSSPSDIFNLVSTNSNVTFHETLTGNISTTTWPIANGTAGYVGFTPNHRCTTGVLAGCSGDVPDGTVVEACSPYIASGADENDRYPILSGTTNVVVTEADAARAITCNPANTTEPSSAPNMDCLSRPAQTTTASPTPTSDATGFSNRRQNIGIVFVLLGAIAMSLL